MALLVVSAATGCVRRGAQGGAGASGADNLAKLRAMLGREVAPVPIQRVQLLGGLAAGEVESISAIRPDCKELDNGTMCSFEADLGPASDGERSTVTCSVANQPLAFGVLVKRLLQEPMHLTEPPAFSAKREGEGISASFVANIEAEDEQNLYVGTAKIAALYARGYWAGCSDLGGGNRATFQRVSSHFFRSLRFKTPPSDATVFELGYQRRVGQRIVGFQYSSVAKRSGQPGFIEQGFQFGLHTTEKSWEVTDGALHVERDADGKVEKLRQSYWKDGVGPLVLTAKPGEEARFRLKLEAGPKSSGIEVTPKAPINTELWAAPQLRGLSAGSRERYEYAMLNVDDSDPSFSYRTITRSSPGVLIEQLADPAQKKTGGVVTNQLSIDARGLVTKEVSTHSISELIHSWGELPVLHAETSNSASAAKVERR